MNTISLTVNGKKYDNVQIEPRTHLGDVLRESLSLTGTHLGCEHGVCGACTVFVDGVPTRSCISLAAACDNAEVVTIEGMNDEVMEALRTAFSQEHGLQCGFCTPGMLASAHDVVMRMPNATEQDIRYAMSGNLCRCTGYVGITKAIQSVIEKRRAEGITEPVNVRTILGPAGAGHAQTQSASAGAAAVPAGMAAEVKRVRAPAGAVKAPDSSKPMTRMQQSFTVDFPRDEVWAFFGRLDQVTTCLPGASLLSEPTATHVEPRLRVKVGPIVADFEGAADVERDDANYKGMIYGSARDTKSPSATRGEVEYVLSEINQGAGTRVDVEIGFALTGPLAQFSRSGIVQDIAKRMTDAFAQNLHARLSNGGESGSTANEVTELNAGALVFSVLRNRVTAFFKRLFGGR
ncbi:2Fe-2S iron-sulfur cluster binding domain-containing protein [Pusillimonas sp. DMV24BSW_D]|uniref:xanthine dehydrogenase family Fe-S subunit n=1 Tax=Neopusillimonas aestuarii TaxID=2716226 RepID=UPI00140AC9CC|nr:2Fe-2S iron-sulfur cluster-binding protein [Pusillimonas sp. DMV24BSW_D]QIM48094.1 2Fe-2S iron-sulfur cluster binding domain-containing protein [Pusillimonas sp. DMV24BSW_D]